MLVERWKWIRVRDPVVLQLREGAVVRSMVGSAQICWVRHDGQLHALEDRCPHQGAALSFGQLEDGLLVCPLHRYRFDPATGRSPDGEGERAVLVPLEIRVDGVYLGRQVMGLRLFGVDVF